MDGFCRTILHQESNVSLSASGNTRQSFSATWGLSIVSAFSGHGPWSWFTITESHATWLQLHRDSIGPFGKTFDRMPNSVYMVLLGSDRIYMLRVHWIVAWLKLLCFFARHDSYATCILQGTPMHCAGTTWELSLGESVFLSKNHRSLEPYWQLWMARRFLERSGYGAMGRSFTKEKSIGKHRRKLTCPRLSSTASGKSWPRRWLSIFNRAT